MAYVEVLTHMQSQAEIFSLDLAELNLHTVLVET